MTTPLNASRRTPVPEILTPRLALIESTPESLRASLDDSSSLGDGLHLNIPPEWPPEHWDAHAIQYLLRKMDAHPEAPGWARYIVLNTGDLSARTLIGSCGAIGPIVSTEEPEIGYSILPSFQCQGFCTEAVLAFCAWIFQHPGIPSICAQTLPHLLPSIRVLEKSGFHFAGPGKEEGAILYRKFK